MFKCSFVIISTCLPFWQRELSSKTPKKKCILPSPLKNRISGRIHFFFGVLPDSNNHLYLA